MGSRARRELTPVGRVLAGLPAEEEHDHEH